MANIEIDTPILLKEIATLSNSNSMLRMECKARSIHEDELMAQIVALAAASSAPKPNRAERRKAKKAS